MTNVLSILNENEYAAYYKSYLEKVEDGDIIKLLIKDFEKQLNILQDLPKEKFAFRYGEDKWSIAELIVHLCDSESVFSYRALTFSRNDKTNLPGFDQDEWVVNSNAKELQKRDIIGLFKTCRNHTIALYKSFNSSQFLNIGIANESFFSVRALAFIILGHNRHHFEIINKYYLSN